MNALVGYTGFVGSNLYSTGMFDKIYNSKNIEMAYGLEPNLLVYAGVRAEKYLANTFPEMDEEQILQAEKNIRLINPQKLVLISTIDVLDNLSGADEDIKVNCKALLPYGFNRYKLEEWVRNNYPDTLIIRLPALFGKNIKKNFIYDYINVVPFMLKPDKYEELMKKNSILEQYYNRLDNGYYQCKSLSENEVSILRDVFKDIGFTALNFTDSRSVFQFYSLSRLWEDIQVALANDLHLWHPATEPVSAAEIYHYVAEKEFVNELGGVPAYYDYRTKYAELFGGSNGYICNKQEILKQIARFINEQEL